MIDRVSETVAAFQLALEDYRRRHGGKGPAKVFVNAAMLDLLQYAPMAELAANKRPEDRSDRRDSKQLLGCRYVSYWDAQHDPEFYLSDQEEE